MKAKTKLSQDETFKKDSEICTPIANKMKKLNVAVDKEKRKL